MALSVDMNGQQKMIPELEDGVSLTLVVSALGLKADRVAIERNGEIVRRAVWESTEVKNGDKLEIVHFVGGGRAG